MGIADFFKKKFGKQTCALCGSECGVMHRSKIKGGEYICNICERQCSEYIRVSEMTKDEVAGHIEYMKRQEKLYQDVFEKAKTETYPSAFHNEAICFSDELGMFTVLKRSNPKNKVNHELFRYDQVASYERYEEKEAPSEPGKPETVKEIGVKIRLLNAQDHVELDDKKSAKGLRPHPYIKREFKVVLHKSDKETDYSDNIIGHFNYIFGVNDDQKGLFSFGMSKQEKRDLKAGVAFIKTAAAAAKVAKEGEESLTEEKKAEIQENMNAMADAQTGGLAEYTRRADAAEEKIN